MADKKPSLIVDVLAGPPSDAEAPAEEVAEEESAPPPRENADALIGDIQAQLERLRGMMAETH